MMSSIQTVNDSAGAADRIDRTAYPFRSRWMELPTGRMLLRRIEGETGAIVVSNRVNIGKHESRMEGELPISSLAGM